MLKLRGSDPSFPFLLRTFHRHRRFELDRCSELAKHVPGVLYQVGACQALNSVSIGPTMSTLAFPGPSPPPLGATTAMSPSPVSVTVYFLLSCPSRESLTAAPSPTFTGTP